MGFPGCTGRWTTMKRTSGPGSASIRRAKAISEAPASSPSSTSCTGPYRTA